jgi:hypothetical protein
MNKYKCIECDRTFTQKSSLKTHLNNRKTPCVKNADYTCEYCDKIFNRKYNLNRHLQSGCAKLPTMLNITIECNADERHRFIMEMHEQKKELRLIKEQNMLLVQENLKLKNDTNKNVIINNNTNNNSHNTTNNNNNTTNNIVNNTIINIHAFCKDDIKYTTNQLKVLLNCGYKAVETTIEHTNFNKNKEQHHNVFLSNIKSKYATIFNGKDWHLEDINKVLDELYEFTRDYLEDKYDEIEEELLESVKKKFKKFIKNEENDKKISKEIKKRLKLLVYNKRKIPINTKKKREYAIEKIIS